MEYRIAQLTNESLKTLTPSENKEILDMFRAMAKTDERFHIYKSESHISNPELKSLKQLVVGGGSLIIVADKETHELVGGCGFRVTDFGILKQGAVSFVYTMPKYRKQGAATAMFNKVNEIAKAAGCTELYITVASANTEAINLYERVGFEPRIIQMLKGVK